MTIRNDLWMWGTEGGKDVILLLTFDFFFKGIDAPEKESRKADT